MARIHLLVECDFSDLPHHRFWKLRNGRGSCCVLWDPRNHSNKWLGNATKTYKDSMFQGSGIPRLFRFLGSASKQRTTPIPRNWNQQFLMLGKICNSHSRYIQVYKSLVSRHTLKYTNATTLQYLRIPANTPRQSCRHLDRNMCPSSNYVTILSSNWPLTDCLQECCTIRICMELWSFKSLLEQTHGQKMTKIYKDDEDLWTN